MKGGQEVSAETMFSLLGGIGLFLYGMTVMSSGLRNACGDNLQVILEKATSNKYVAVLVGLAVTVLVQSSSATDIMVIGFVNSGMMSLSQAIGVIMGANIGTTVTAQITAFNISAYAPVILFAGAVMFLFLKHSRIKYIGEFLMGFGMLFVGISIMKSAIAPLADSPGFIRILSELLNQIRFSASKQILTEVALIKLARPQMETGPDALLDRIRCLEENGVQQNAAPAPRAAQLVRNPDIIDIAQDEFEYEEPVSYETPGFYEAPIEGPGEAEAEEETEEQEAPLPG